MLAYLMYDLAKARQVVSLCHVAERQGVTADIVSDSSVGSESYWRNEQDILSDVVRIMRDRHFDEEGYPELYTLRLQNQARCLSG